MGKLVCMIISHFNTILGVKINTRRMEAGPPPEFLARTVEQLDAFHEGRKAFTVQETSTLVGHLSHIATTSRWLAHLLSHLYTSISAALKVNCAYEIDTNKAFRQAMKKVTEDDTKSTHLTQGYINRTVHESKRSHFLNSTAIEELRLIRLVLSSESISLRTPIAHLVSRDPTAEAWGDSSLDAAGGFSLRCRVE